MPKVSICIPCYNNSADVKRLLQSIKAQSYTDFEVIISDDSTDTKIEELVRQYQAAQQNVSASVPAPEKDKVNHQAAHLPEKNEAARRLPVHPEAEPEANSETKPETETKPYRFVISYTHNKKPLGVVLNWNTAIRKAHGEYIKIMFSDDWFTNAKSLAAFVAMLEEHPEADLAFSGSRQCHVNASDDSANGQRGTDSSNDPANGQSHDGTNWASHQDYDRSASDEFIAALQQDYRTLFCSNQIGAPSATIYRRMPARKSYACPLFDEESGFASDVFLYMEILSHHPIFAWTKEPLVCIGLHERQYTQTFSELDPGKYKDYRLLFQKYELWKSPAYRHYFLQEYLLPWHKNMAESRALHIPDDEYRKAWLDAKKNTVKSFLHARFSHS